PQLEDDELLALLAPAEEHREHVGDGDRVLAAADVRRHAEHEHRDAEQEHEHVPRPPDQRDAPRAEGGAAGHPVHGPVEDGHQIATIFRRCTSQTKNGPPMSASTIPTCSSPGRTTTRPMTSATSSSAPPASAEAGSGHRWSGPVTDRTTCGTTRPTNAIGPHAAVAEPARRVIATTPITRVRCTEWPRERATSSPSDSAFRAGAPASPSSAPAPRNQITWPAISTSRPASDPTAQKR